MASIQESLKPSLSMKKAIEDMQKSMAKIPKINIPSIASPDYRMLDIPKLPTQEEVNDYQSASVLMEVLANEALQWKEQLPKDYTPAIRAILYGGIQIQVHSLSKVSFHGIRIEGLMNGAPCSLLAHQSTVQLLCYGEEVTPDMERHPIGFIWDNNKVEV